MSYADLFNDILDLQVKNGLTFREIIEEDVQNLFVINRASIERGEIPIPALSLTIAFACTSSGRATSLRKPIDNLLNNNGPYTVLDNPDLVLNVYSKHGKYYEQATKNLNYLAGEISTLQQNLSIWPQNKRFDNFFPAFSAILEKLDGIGLKGKSTIMRDCGYFLLGDRLACGRFLSRFRFGIWMGYNKSLLPDLILLALI